MAKTKLIIAGNRNFKSYYFVLDQFSQYLDYLEETKPNNKFILVNGLATGVDALAYKIAKANNMKIKEFPADWDKHPRAAGPIRNAQMADYATELLAIWDHKSKGTKNMIEQMQQRNKPVKIVRI